MPPVPLLLLLLFGLATVYCGPQYDLYLDADDVELLMGLAARLYYVRGGQPNVNAARYVVEVPSFVNSVNVTWSARGGGLLNYRIGLHSDRVDAVAAKLLNVPAEGTVPGSRSAFAVSLPCTNAGQATNVRLTVETCDSDWQSTGTITTTSVVFKKLCLDGRQDDIGTSSEFGPIAFYHHMIAAASALVALAVICCLTTTYQRGKARDLMIIKGFQNNEVNVFLKSALNSSNKFSQKSSSSSLPPGLANRTTAKVKDLHECIVELSVQRHRVRLQNAELEGTFGRVYRGLYTDGNGKEEDVFVKTVTDQASAVQISVLLHEGLSLYGLNHKNVLTVQAVSVEQHVEPYILYPYNNNKNLKKFLQNCKTSESMSYTLTTREIINMTLQIINGMQYLHRNRHLHKDVAARNCLINPELKIQIADNALSRDLFPGDYHCLGDNKNRPIKWMAVESLEYKKFSTASDIWSFGVLLWELLTLCQQPYADIDPFEISAYLQDGFRLTQPINCPDELFTVMACCWALAPNERPTFSQLSIFMNEFNNQLVKFV